MMSAFFHFQHTSNRLFNNYIKSYIDTKLVLLEINLELNRKRKENLIKIKYQRGKLILK